MRWREMSEHQRAEIVALLAIFLGIGVATLASLALVVLQLQLTVTQ